MSKEKICHGVILAGGRSQRFGSDKALALFEGRPFVSRAVDLVRSVGLAACVITEQHKDYSFLDCPIYFDRQSFRGPLAGLERAFEVFPDEAILVLTCDMPFLVKEDLERLLTHEQEGFDAVLYRLEDDRFQPFPGIYDSSLKNAICLHDEKANSMQFFIKKIERVLEVKVVTSQDHFRNINRSIAISSKYDSTHILTQ